MSLRLSAADTGELRAAEYAGVGARVVSAVNQRHVGVFVVERAVVGLVEQAVGGAEVPQREGFFGLFDREEEAVRLAVYRHPREGAQRRGDAEPRHKAVGDEIFR